jgi:hypothetical protein
MLHTCRFEILATGISSVSDQYRIHLMQIRIRIQHCRLNTDPDSIFWGSKNTIYLSLGLHTGLQATEEPFSSQKRTSSTSKHENSQFFLLFWAIFALLDPDPDQDSEYGSGSTELIASGPIQIRNTGYKS